ncbi:hypothetical protein ACHAWO_010099 [Cyclotella atomus]|uniref:START domain-containing protein n=1 Tax=Cyclotella atomus TaxID=382360 RepID=A0ABD3QUQ4_9STRA
MGFVKKISSSGGSRRSSSRNKPAIANSMPVVAKQPSIIKRRSLCTGSFTLSGLVDIAPSPSDLSTPKSLNTQESDSFSEDELDSNLSPKKIVEAVIHRIPTLFIRTADLPSMRESEHRRQSSLLEQESDWIDHYHKSSSIPPLSSIADDPNESWVALDDGNGNSAPLADAAVKSLVKTALDTAMNREMWTSNGPTAKLLKNGDWDDTIFTPLNYPAPIPHSKGSKGENDVLVWSGTFSHSYYGSDLPAIRCEAIVNMSPSTLAELLIDSTRVKEYNKMSIGRDDILILQQTPERVTKVSVGKSKPPMLGKILQLKTLLHMEELPHKKGYILVSRAVAHKEENETEEDPKVIHSEMLMGVNIIRAVEGEEDRCILITLNHLKSPMIPMMLAKKLGLGAAVNFINDIRALC